MTRNVIRFLEVDGQINALYLHGKPFSHLTDRLYELFQTLDLAEREHAKTKMAEALPE